MAPTALAEAPAASAPTRSVFEDNRVDLDLCPDCEAHLLPAAAGVTCGSCGWLLRF